MYMYTVEITTVLLIDKRHNAHPAAKFMRAPPAALTTAAPSAGFSMRPNINACCDRPLSVHNTSSFARTTQTQDANTQQYSLLRQPHPQCSASIPDPNQHHRNQTPHRRKAKTTRRKDKDKAHSSCRLALRAQAQTRTHKALKRSMAFRRTSWRSRYVGGKASRCST